MSDPLQPVLPGTPLLDVVTADRMNALSESARRERLSRERATPGVTSQRYPDSITIFVRNDTGTTFAINTAVQIGGPIGPPVSGSEYWQRGRVYGGILPTAAGVIYGITEEPILASGVGRVVVAGIVPVTLTITDAGDTYADTATSSGELTTSTSGTARILWKESGTGAGKRGVVQLVRPSSSGGGSLAISFQIKTEGIDGLTSPPEPLDPPSIVSGPIYVTFLQEDGFSLEYTMVGDELLNGEVFVRLPMAGREIWTGTVSGWLADYEFEEGEGVGVQHLGRGSKIVNGALGFGSNFTEYPPGSGDTALQFRLKTSWLFCDVPPEDWEPTYRLGFGFTKPDWKTTSFAALLRPNMDDVWNEVVDSNHQWTPNIANQMFQDLAVGWLRSIGWTTVLGETESEGLLDGARLILRSYLPYPINPDGRTGDFEFSIKTLPANAFTDAGITTIRCDHDINIELVDYGNPADDPFPAKYTRLQINGMNTVRTANGMGSVNVRHGLVVEASVEVPEDSVNSAAIQDAAVLPEHLGFDEIDGGTW